MSNPDGEHRTTRHQDAVRLLFIMSEAGTVPSPAAPRGSVRVVHSQMRLQALDFWMRNPDYLADELLTEYSAGTRADGLQIAGSILESDEPDLRRYPMVRYLLGAYEPLDDALAVLRSAGLIEIVREGDPDAGRVREHHFFLLASGHDAVSKLIEQAPPLRWYEARARLVASLAGQHTGSQLKDRQYKRIEYARTKLGTTIGSIAESVRDRVQRLASPLERGT
jgi:hypothetical protein